MVFSTSAISHILGLYIGVGITFTIMGKEDAFDQLPRHVAIFIGIIIAWTCYDRKTKFTKKLKYLQNMQVTPVLLI